MSFPCDSNFLWGSGTGDGISSSDRHTERDSRKDEAVVFIFIFATVGLLAWAAIKPWVGKWVEVGENLPVE